MPRMNKRELQHPIARAAEQETFQLHPFTQSLLIHGLLTAVSATITYCSHNNGEMSGKFAPPLNREAAFLLNGFITLLSLGNFYASFRDSSYSFTSDQRCEVSLLMLVGCLYALMSLHKGAFAKPAVASGLLATGSVIMSSIGACRATLFTHSNDIKQDDHRDQPDVQSTSRR